MSRSRAVATYDAVVASPLGALGLCLRDGVLVQIDFLPPESVLLPPRMPAVRDAVAQLAAYFAAPGHQFTLPVAPAGTAFQQRVWEALRTIPDGQVVRYGELARRLASGPRAVGQACRSNPIPIVIPCHRVVSATGLGGYSGATAGPRLAVKQWLLRHEGCAV